MTERWDQVMATIASAVPEGATIVIDSRRPAATESVADRLAGRFTIGTGAESMLIWLRTPPDGGAPAPEPHAEIVIDVRDPDWPVIRHISDELVPLHVWYLRESQAFFGSRAVDWDEKYGDDIPAYNRAVEQAGVPRGATAIDVGCGTGRALAALRAAVGPEGTVVGIDHTGKMLEVARAKGRTDSAHLVLADAQRLPLREGCVDAIFAAGLVMHLPDLDAGLAELARVAATGGRLVLFHPSGRVALAARQGRTVRPDDPLSRPVLAGHLGATGWSLAEYEDAEERFFAIAIRDAD